MTSSVPVGLVLVALLVAFAALLGSSYEPAIKGLLGAVLAIIILAWLVIVCGVLPMVRIH